MFLMASVAFAATPPELGKVRWGPGKDREVLRHFSEPAWKEELLTHVKERGCADHVFATDKDERRLAEPIFAGRVSIAKERARSAPQGDQKRHLSRSPYGKLDLTPTQSVRVNAALAAGEDPRRWLSPRQQTTGFRNSVSELRAGELLRRALRALARPIEPESRVALARAWARVPASLRGPRQFLGRQYAGCSATIGAMPRCDFACRGGYLGRDANRAKPLPLRALFSQLRSLRAWLGPGGNLQLTDGEVELRDPEELLALCRGAREIGLVPMLMTHGEGLRRDPRRLDRLVREGGLGELSIHIDSTQRGRRDPRYRYATTERALAPLRDEFAALIRKTRRRTRRRLQAASTVTVTRDNLGEVADIVAWMVRNADAFKMVSFQPVADVGRTEAALRGAVSREALWFEIARGLGLDAADLSAQQGFLGHPECSRFAQGVVATRPGAASRFVPLLDQNDSRDRRLGERLFERFGGLTFRLDSLPEALARAAGLFCRAPVLLAIGLPAWSWRVLGRVAPGGRLPLMIEWLTGRTQFRYHNIVSHHFMDAEELATPLGRERLDLCAFKVSVDGEMVSMCEVNASGLRERLYERWTQEGSCAH